MKTPLRRWFPNVPRHTHPHTYPNVLSLAGPQESTPQPNTCRVWLWSQTRAEFGCGVHSCAPCLDHLVQNSFFPSANRALVPGGKTGVAVKGDHLIQMFNKRGTRIHSTAKSSTFGNPPPQEGFPTIRMHHVGKNGKKISFSSANRAVVSSGRKTGG